MGMRQEIGKGLYRWPAAEAGQSKIVLSHEEMALLLSGIELAGSRRRSWFRKTIEEENRGANEAEKIHVE